MSLAADKKLWDKLHEDLKKKSEALLAYEIELGTKYGHNFQTQWLSTAQKKKLEKLRDAKEKTGEKIYELVARISPRQWDRGVPSWWVRSELTWEDAIRPKDEPLSVIVPGSYGVPDGTVKEAPVEQDPETAGIEYATAQLESDYFMDWVREQLSEASRMDPNDVLPLETKKDATVIARNMLKQLEWDTKRDLKESKEFFAGFHRGVTNPSTVDWLADELLELKGQMRGGGVSEAGPKKVKRDRRKDQYVYVDDLRKGDVMLDLDSDAEWTVASDPVPAPEKRGYMRVDLLINGVTTPSYFYGESTVPIKRRRQMRGGSVSEAPVAAKTRLDQLLDQVDRGKREVTIDAEGYTPEQIDRIISAAKARGFHVSGTRRWLLIRNLEGKPRYHHGYNTISPGIEVWVSNDQPTSVRISGPATQHADVERKVQAWWGEQGLHFRWLSHDRADIDLDPLARKTHVRDYIAIDRHDRPVGPRHKGYSDAKRDADNAGGTVKFVPSTAREARRPKAVRSARRRR